MRSVEARQAAVGAWSQGSRRMTWLPSAARPAIIRGADRPGTRSEFMTRRLRLILLAATLLAGAVLADDFRAVNTEKAKTAPPTPEEAARMLHLPPGFRATLFAGEPDVRQPIAMTTDDRGRLWVAECYTYAERAVNFAADHRDRVVILEDADGDGKFDKRTV